MLISDVTFNEKDCQNHPAVSIITDSGGFEGIYIAAHELGHMWVLRYN